MQLLLNRIEPHNWLKHCRDRGVPGVVWQMACYLLVTEYPSRYELAGLIHRLNCIAECYALWHMEKQGHKLVVWVSHGLNGAPVNVGRAAAGNR